MLSGEVIAFCVSIMLWRILIRFAVNTEKSCSRILSPSARTSPVTVDLNGMVPWDLDQVRPPYGRFKVEKSDGVFS